MTYILSLSAQSGKVIKIDRSCSYCESSTGHCLGLDCLKIKIDPDWHSNSNTCYCSEDKCNANIESNASIHMQYFWPKLMLSFVIYFMFLY